jgi:hypothetical protein
MIFRDINYINHHNLVSTTKFQEPYRNSGNAYPLGDRKYSARHFRKEDDGSFSIWYSNREQTDQFVTGTTPTANKRHENYMKNCRLGVVRPDNSFEFVATLYEQGENMMLSESLGGHLYNDVTRGGLMFTKGKFTHPVFTGLRINCNTGKAITDYKIFRKILDRKKANEYMKRYEEFKRVGPMMYQSMTDRGISEVYDDLYTEYGDEGFTRLGNVEAMRMVKEGKYVDAVCAFGLHHQWGTLYDTKQRAILRAAGEPVSDGYFKLNPRVRETTLKRIKDEFRDIAVAEENSLFEYEELEAGHRPPASKWKYKITVNDEPVNRV